MLAILSTNVAATSWDKAIAAVEKKAAAFGEKGHGLGGYSLGSSYGAFRMDEHRCVILGYMLNKKDVISHLDIPTKPNLVTGDDYILEATSLYNWAHMARHLKGKSLEFQAKLWNRECAGKLGIPRSANVREASKNAFYQLSDDGRTLMVLGGVTRGYSARLRAALDENPRVVEVSLGSDGGHVAEALRAGTEIRNRQLDTVLYGDCYSACPLVFMGGVKRIVWAPHDDLGFHQISGQDGSAVAFDDPIYKLVVYYVNEMGIDANLILRYFNSASPADIFVPNVGNYCAGNLVTWAQRLCGG